MYNYKMKDIIGNKFGKLKVIKVSGNRGNRGQIRYVCLCDCGNNHEVSGESIRKGHTKSCGCLVNEINRYNCIEDREHATWKQLYNSTIVKRSKKNGYTTDIQLLEFINISKKSCYYCGLDSSNTIKDRSKKSNLTINFNGIDRIDSNIGYTSSNVVSCCKYCNFAKNNMTQKEFKEFIIRLYTNYIKQN